MYNKFLGYLIKDIRCFFDMTQKEMAKKIDRSEIAIRKYESGQVKIPFTVLFVIIKILDIDINLLQSILYNIKIDLVDNNILNNEELTKCLDQFYIDIGKIYKLDFNEIDINEVESIETIKILLSNEINEYIEKYILYLAQDQKIDLNLKLLDYRKKNNIELIKIKNNVIDFLNYNIEKIFNEWLKKLRNKQE
ncbi:helix-turn-helix transcriptional regulator [Fusobacterium polymorphum]|uniref:helix-turn-helix domain-containing protein n=1 Tax=Fusobacterium nucleatum subsp. polymorphum TaxID=76857 RepID=UPI0030083DD6